MAGPVTRDPVLLVEDKDSLRAMLRHALESQGHAVVEAIDQAGAVACLQTSSPAVVLTDLRLASGDGFGVLGAARAHDPSLQVIVMTGYGGVEDAVRAMRDGALDFLAKPIDPEHLLLLVERALAQRRLLAEHVRLQQELAERRGAPRIIGQSAALCQALQHLDRAAGSDATVLLEGESGTGKELFARALHARGARAEGPFIAINCAAIPENLLETELFGHEKGAFTGAAARKPGRFELAHRGTLFLDEIGELPLPLQAKLLRVLEEQRFERVGGTHTIQVDVRVVAATNRHLAARVTERQFREDLFFRLSVFPIRVPALRERIEDIGILAHHFIERFSREGGRPPLSLSPAALDALGRYGWPGNIRELQNCLERAVILCDGATLDPAHLNLPTVSQRVVIDADPWEAIDLSGPLDDVLRRIAADAERRTIARALERADGDVHAASAALAVEYKFLIRRIEAYGIAVGRPSRSRGHADESRRVGAVTG